jgi:hypothetical protein
MMTVLHQSILRFFESTYLLFRPDSTYKSSQINDDDDEKMDEQEIFTDALQVSEYLYRNSSPVTTLQGPQSEQSRENAQTTPSPTPPNEEGAEEREGEEDHHQVHHNSVYQFMAVNNATTQINHMGITLEQSLRNYAKLNIDKDKVQVAMVDLHEQAKEVSRLQRQLEERQRDLWTRIIALEDYDRFLNMELSRNLATIHLTNAFMSNRERGITILTSPEIVEAMRVLADGYQRMFHPAGAGAAEMA